MSRNEQCFCGSGKKQKKCHPDIHEKSFSARVLELFRKIDSEMEKHFQSTKYEFPCNQPECAECCYDYFTVSDIEYSTILFELRKWNEEDIENLKHNTERQWKMLQSQYPELAKNLEKDATGRSEVMLLDRKNSVQKTGLPCLFLNLNTNRCKIYSVRPTICREFGTGYRSSNKKYDYSLCSCIPSSISATIWQADLTHLEEEFDSLIRLYSKKYNVYIELRPYPLVYRLFMDFFKYKNGIRIKNFHGKFQISEQQYVSNMVENNKQVFLETF